MPQGSSPVGGGESGFAGGKVLPPANERKYSLVFTALQPVRSRAQSEQYRVWGSVLDLYLKNVI